MSLFGHSSTPERLAQQATTTRAQLDRTLEALAGKLSVTSRVREARAAVGAAASEFSRSVCPGITAMIRFDHGHVLAAFRRYRSSFTSVRKRAIVANVCLALEIHTQLEEEIFYPALFAVGESTDHLDQSFAEHDQMRALIARLRQMSARDAGYDETFYQLIRTVLTHIADEETTLIPLAESRMKDKLRELGWRMATRRLELLKPHRGQAIVTTAATFPILSGAVVLGAVAAGWLTWRAVTSPWRA